MSTRMLSVDAVAERLGVSKRTLYSEISEGRFPRPVQLTARRVAWPEAEVEAWLQARIEARDSEAA